MAVEASFHSFTIFKVTGDIGGPTKLSKFSEWEISNVADQLSSPISLSVQWLQNYQSWLGGYPLANKTYAICAFKFPTWIFFFMIHEEKLTTCITHQRLQHNW